jgi:hypothetical protein
MPMPAESFSLSDEQPLMNSTLSSYDLFSRRLVCHCLLPPPDTGFLRCQRACASHDYC